MLSNQIGVVRITVIYYLINSFIYKCIDLCIWKKNPGILLKGYQKILEALNALIASWKLKQKPEKSCTWANVQISQMSQCTKSQEYAWCTWDRGWQAKLEKQLSTSWFSSLPTRTVRHAWTDQTLIKMSWAETPQLLLFDQHLTQGMKIGLLSQSYLWKKHRGCSGFPTLD